MGNKNKGTINRERIGGKKPVIPVNSADRMFLDGSSVSDVPSGVSRISRRPQIVNEDFISVNFDAKTASNPPIKNESAKDLFQKIDVPNLNDIEIILPIEKYFDAVTKEEKARVKIKVKNSSIKSDEVVGIDIRIINTDGGI